MTDAKALLGNLCRALCQLESLGIVAAVIQLIDLFEESIKFGFVCANAIDGISPSAITSHRLATGAANVLRKLFILLVRSDPLPN